MDNETFLKIAEALRNSTKDPGRVVVFNDSGYSAIPFSADNFQTLARQQLTDVAFIDGGNAEIISAPSFSLQLLRTASVRFNPEREEITKRECFCLVTLNSDMVFEVTLAGDFELSMSFDSSEFETPSQVADLVRRILEIRTAQQAKSNTVVLDGLLKAEHKYESRSLEELSTMKKVASLAKTCTLYTNSGNSLIGSLASIAPAGSWLYHPLVRITNVMHRAEIFIAKLNRSASHMFRVEVASNVPDKKAMLGMLASNSNDYAFPGYPYGLILADRFARVSNREKERLRTLFLHRSGDQAEKLKPYINSINAHDILDSIS